jgi:formimidoylglutamate deiminase
VAASPQSGRPSTAERLFTLVADSGSAAAGEPAWGLIKGARADAVLADRREPALLGVPASHTLDALVFSSPGQPWRNVMVAGRWVIRDSRHAQSGAIANAFAQAMAELRA